MGIRAEIKDAIVNGHLYDFVSNNSHRMDKDDFIDLVKNLDFTVYQNGKKEYESFCEKVIENLDDVDYFAEEEEDA